MQEKQLENIQIAGIFQAMMDNNYWSISLKQWEITKELNTKSKNDELSNHLSSLSLNEINNYEIQIHETLLTTNKSQQLEAKIIELNQWQNEQVYDEIDDLAQQCISLKWVMKKKAVNKEKIIKAHLCTKGFWRGTKFQNRQFHLFQRRTLIILLHHII